MDNMRLYEMGRAVPAEAKKAIKGGRLNGMTDINPMFRIKRLTEMFGPCGIGWWYVIKDKRIEVDEITKQKAAFVDIDLFYKDPTTGETSHGIPGTGGSSFVAQENKGPYLSDECFKMALTDAIGVSCKALGIGADVYWDKDRSKYDNTSEHNDKSGKGSKGASNKPIEVPPKGERDREWVKGDGEQIVMGSVEDTKKITLAFGPYEGKNLAEVFECDKKYAQFLYESEEVAPIIRMGIGILLDDAILRKRARNAS